MKLVKFGDEALCVLLHAFLVLLYLALVVIASHHYEHGLSHPFSSSTQTAMSITVSVIAQTFGTLYLAALVLVTQRLSLIRDIHTRQTLTALHDKLSAWLGLGSSILTLVDQVKVPAALSSVMFIALYLGGVAVLHIAIPASVSVVTYNATALRSYPTKLARPYTLFGPEGNASHVLWDILRVYGQFPQIGLQDNLVYDVVPTIQSATKDVIVNATRFTADCGLVPDTIQTDFARDGGTTNQWVFNVNTNVSLQLDVQAPSQLSTKGTWYPLGDMNLNVIGITSTIPVVDATGANATLVPINPGLLYRMVPNNGPNRNVNWVQILACNINSENTTIAVSAINGAPITRPAAVQNDVVWKNWAVPQVPTDPLLLSISVVIPQSPDGAQDVGANGMYEGIYLKQTDGPYRWNSSEIDLVEPASTSALDDFIMQDLSTKQSSSNPSEWNTIQVTDLQLALGKAIAAMVWYHRNGNHSNVFSYNAAWMLNEDRVGLADVEVAVLRLRLSFNVIPLAVGLGISCGLFLITFLLSRRPLRSEGSSKLRAIGILQLTWLLGNESHLVGVRKPDHQKLRKAGLFDVQMSARAQQKMSQVEEEYEASELTVLDESHDSDSDALCEYNR